MGEFMSPERQHDYIIAEISARWYGRLNNAGYSDRKEFVRWLKRSPVHVREMLFATMLDELLTHCDSKRRFNILDLLKKGNSNVEPLRPLNQVISTPEEPQAKGGENTDDKQVEPPPSQSPEHRERTSAERSVRSEPLYRRCAGWWIGCAFAASMLGAVTLGWPGILGSLHLQQRYQTATGEQQTISLNDGSVVYLNTQSKARVSYSEATRDVYLDGGQAIFKVAHDSERPFRVFVDKVVVQAVGTQFDVASQSEYIDVAVIEGAVKVVTVSGQDVADIEHAATTLPAGKGVRITADGNISAPTDIDISDMVAWRQHRLVFRNHTLAEIAEQFNRYNSSPKILVEGAVLRSKRFSGVFDANDPESFLQYLEATEGQLAFDRSDESQIVIRARTSYALVSNHD